MDPMQLLATVNGFYDQSFNKLLIVTFGLIAFLGVLVPVVVGWVQLRSLRAEKGSLLSELKTEVDEERRSIKSHIEEQVESKISEIRDQYEKRFAELSNKLKRASSEAEARAYHLQGNTRLDGTPVLSISDYCHAAPLYIKAGDEANGQRCIKLLVEHCLPKTFSSEYKQYKGEKSCKRLIEQLKELNNNRRYDNDIDRIELEMENAATREKPKKTISAPPAPGE